MTLDENWKAFMDTLWARMKKNVSIDRCHSNHGALNCVWPKVSEKQKKSNHEETYGPIRKTNKPLGTIRNNKKAKEQQGTLRNY